MERIFTTGTPSATSIKRILEGAYWQTQTAAVEADSLSIGERAAHYLAWENRSRKPMPGLLVAVDR